MLNEIRKRNVDLLVDEFWKHGYTTLFRKYGTYLPEPSKVGEFEVDIVARYKKNFAIGVTLSEDDFNDPALIEKLRFLATRQTKYTNKRVILFLGIPEGLMKNAKVLIEMLEAEIRKNIKLIPIVDKEIISRKNSRRENSYLFS